MSQGGFFPCCPLPKQGYICDRPLHSLNDSWCNAHSACSLVVAVSRKECLDGILKVECSQVIESGDIS